MGDNIFKAPESTSQQMADSLPDGCAWSLKNEDDSNLRKLINSLSVAHNTVQQLIELLDDEFRINQTYDLLDEWEESVGIPGECIGLYSTIAERRQAVIDRFKKQPIVTLADMQAYVDALFPGVGIVLYPGWEYLGGFEYEFEVPLWSAVGERFVLVARVPIPPDGFEYEFELQFEGLPDVTELECLLNQINPACVYVLIDYGG